MIWKTSHRAGKTGFGMLIFTLAMGFILASCENVRAAKRDNLSPEYSYSLELNGTVIGFFMYAFNVGSENEIIERRIGGKSGNGLITKLPGKVKFREITLKKSLSGNLDQEKWKQLVGKEMTAKTKKNGVISLVDKSLHEVARWNLKNTWPKKFVRNSTTGSSSKMMFESITLESEAIERVK